MATFYSTGPVLLFVGPQVFKPSQYTALTSLPPVFLGTAEVSPQAEIRRQYQPAYNDMSGAVPFDLNFLGEDAVIAIDLTRWDEVVYRTLATSPGAFGQTTAMGSPRGRYSALNGMGTLQAHDGLSLCVYMVFPYGFPAAAPVNNAGRGNGMPGGYRWHGGALINDKLHQMGSKYRKLHLTFQCAPVYDYQTAVFNLYDHLGITSSMATPAAIA